MNPNLVVIHSTVGGGHKAAAMAAAEAARARGLSVEVLDTFDHAPKVFGQAYLAAHLTWQGTMPELYGAAYFASYRCDGALEPVRRGIDHVAWGGLVHHVVKLRPRAVIATHHLPLVVLARARRHGWLRAPLIGVVTDYGAHAVWVERGTDALCVPGGGALRDVVWPWLRRGSRPPDGHSGAERVREPRRRARPAPGRAGPGAADERRLRRRANPGGRALLRRESRA